MNFNVEILSSELFKKHITFFLEVFKSSRIPENQNNPKIVYEIQKSV
jgi:hypothetical protein